MAKIFVSHAGDDREPTDEVHQWLAAEGHEVFLDQHPRDGIEVGQEWEQRLNERLRWADAVVCVVTSAFLASEWCNYEVACAQARGSRLLPVRAEPEVEHKLLKSVQYADLSTTGRATLVETLRRADATGGLGWADDRSPFPGLRPFEVEDHRVFFGRGGEVEQLASLLRSPTERAERAVLLVMGPSGCGKSSLVRAGLLHVMAEEPGWYTLAPILPGADPVAALVRELAAAAQQLDLDWTVAQVRHQLNDGGLIELADELLLTARARRLLLVVDQFEELLTQAPPEQRARFAQLLHPALGGPVQVVATLRPEFLDQLLVDTDLAVLPTRSYPLRPLNREALRTVIEGPARLAGIGVDDDLVARLVADTDSGEALPLLAFTLAQLADDVGRGGQLSSARYEQLGGVRGALTRQADAALTDATKTTGRSSEEVIAGLLRLITVDEQGRPTRWRVACDELLDPVTREVDIFVALRGQLGAGESSRAQDAAPPQATRGGQQAGGQPLDVTGSAEVAGHVHHVEGHVVGRVERKLHPLVGRWCGAIQRSFRDRARLRAGPLVTTQGVRAALPGGAAGLHQRRATVESGAGQVQCLGGVTEVVRLHRHVVQDVRPQCAVAAGLGQSQSLNEITLGEPLPTGIETHVPAQIAQPRRRGHQLPTDSVVIGTVEQR